MPGRGGYTLPEMPIFARRAGGSPPNPIPTFAFYRAIRPDEDIRKADGRRAVVTPGRRRRTSRRLSVVLGLCLLMLPSIPAHAAPAPGAARESALDPRFGVVEAWRQPAQAADLGVGWERLTLWWKAFQPTGPDSWNYFATGHDGYINREIAAGRQVVGELINTPDWAAADLSQRGDSVPKGLYRAYEIGRAHV